MDLVKSRVHKGWRAICIDGSAFDSTQNATMMELIDNSFFKICTSGIRHMINDFKNQYPSHFRK